MKRTLLFIVLLLLAACSKPATPDWIKGASAEYSTDRYLLGRGQADSIARAGDRARADLAKVFTVLVQERSHDQLLWQRGGEGLESLQSSVSRQIRAQTDQLLEGVRIAETWQAEEGGDYYVLAILDRLQAETRIRAKIFQLDDETTQNIERAKRETNLAEQIAAARDALLAQFERQHEQQLLTIIDRTGSGITPRYKLSELKNDFDQLLERWQIAPQVLQDDFGGLHDILVGALGNIGLQHGVSIDAADYLLIGELVSEELNTADGWFWLRGALTVSLVDRDNGGVLGTHEWPFKTSSRQQEMVSIRARQQLKQVLDRELLKVLIDFGNAAQPQR